MGKKVINLALQGGGAHGAFTWGVLDALLEDGRIRFEGVSGTSAGAMNAVVLAQGLMEGGASGARRALDRFWLALANRMPTDLSHGDVGGSIAKVMQQWTRYLSPSQMNPFDLNPLRDLVANQIDFAALQKHSPVKLFIATTHANSGKLRIFQNHEMSIDVILASACLPTIYRSVFIDGEPYWDGAYAANPAVFPLFEYCDSGEILLVLLQPLYLKSTPDSVREIQNRIMDITFQSGFLREMQMFTRLKVRRPLFVWSKLERHIARTHFHLIEADLGQFNAESKLTVNLKFFVTLRDMGQEAGKKWLTENYLKLDKSSSIDLSGMFA
ncbi:patatin-like phospholipase family protein [Iodobacter ciconiae]|uniref:Patatin-like phospholipase family protein n=1 Tax=Iodobacter ciconiae TaxID=2496266 RepID=A0A3S8ZW59_9NEIS|nr:patatin-like phospholipase family protein [Iodobacter ciconiae]AZN37655.1 patatin-like phospholipase family protein [Iodobacter ciconiae]